jgi:hypothetical protein
MVSDDIVKQALAELGDIVRCRCHAAYTDRKLHDPDCNCDSAEALQIVSGRVEALQAQLAKAREGLDRMYSLAEDDCECDACKAYRETLALLDTPTPAPSPDTCPFGDDCDLTVAYMAGAHDARKMAAPSPDALVRAAEMMVKAYRKDSDQTIKAFYALEDALAAMKGGDT